MQPIPRKNFPSLIGQMPINDFRKINIGSVLNEVARVVKLLQTVLVLNSFLIVLTKIVTTLGSTGPIQKLKWDHDGEKRVTIFKTVNSTFNSLI